MLAVVLAALTASTSPSPSPTPLLKTIVTVKASPFCGALAAHLNAAIGSTLANDQTLGMTIIGLRSHDLAGSDIQRNNEIMRLENLGDAIYKQYRLGESEVKLLRTLASTSSDNGEKAAVKGAADALGGALYRQHLIQRDLDGFLAFLNTADMRSGFDESEANEARSLEPTDVENAPVENEGPAAYWLPPGYDRFLPPVALQVGHESHDEDVDMAGVASSDFQSRLPAIMQDEINAGNHIEAAGNNC
jgi:hypothetical protein